MISKLELVCGKLPQAQHPGQTATYVDIMAKTSISIITSFSVVSLITVCWQSISSWQGVGTGW